MKQSCIFLLTALLCAAQPQLWAQRHHHEHEQPQRSKASPCFDPSDPSEIPLWGGVQPPGAIGEDPCRDIPYLQAFTPETPSREPRPTILIIPGGGYNNLTNEKEQAPVAEYFASTLHITTFVLHYRLVQDDGTYRYPIPMLDGQRAIRLLRARARELQIDPHSIALFGFSAGGHLASTLALHPHQSFGKIPNDLIDSQSAEVNLLGLGYPVISMNPSAVPPSGSYRHLLFGFEGHELNTLEHQLSGEMNINAELPPVFLFESTDDKRISPQNAILFANALQQAHLPVEFHLFPHGEHGSGLSEGIAGEDQWPSMFTAWILQQWPQLRHPRIRRDD
ncbi:MAG: alpha/beta hydrolase [Acidobacteriaceae bacterium]|nr:alpha/beta hydrolase [Acidobacteriaceae bacterium]